MKIITPCFKTTTNKIKTKQKNGLYKKVLFVEGSKKNYSGTFFLLKC